MNDTVGLLQKNVEGVPVYENVEEVGMSLEAKSDMMGLIWGPIERGCSLAIGKGEIALVAHGDVVVSIVLAFIISPNRIVLVFSLHKNNLSYTGQR